MATIATELLDGETKRDLKGRKITPKERRAELVAAYRSSGLTMKQFARREGINRFTLAKWASLENQRAVARFTEVKLPMPLGPGWSFEIGLPNGVTVRAATAGAVAELVALIRA